MGCIQSLDWTTGCSFFFHQHINIWAIELVVAIATLNLKYAGEPVYLVLPVHLRIVCNSLS